MMNEKKRELESWRQEVRACTAEISDCARALAAEGVSMKTLLLESADSRKIEEALAPLAELSVFRDRK